MKMYSHIKQIIIMVLLCILAEGVQGVAII